MAIAIACIVGGLFLLAILIGLKRRIGRALRHLMLILMLLGILGGGFYIHHKMADPSSNKPRTERQAKVQRKQPAQPKQQQNKPKAKQQGHRFNTKKAESEADKAGDNVQNKASQAPSKGQNFIKKHWKALAGPALLALMFLVFITDDPSNQPHK